ncbi:glutathione S-transferase family protein [Magnetococcus sp. PR-3]|uniref:glutathione S-transferase family protein n=1 Tax=Magnetococcus sp. PR-3 TaxID=3120355 RepID=UPI002FCE5B72
MSSIALTIGNQNYSSWSLRPWLVLSMAQVDFSTTILPLFQVDHETIMGRHTPAGKVPFLQHDDLVIWESLAICEYIAELYPNAQLWPEDPQQRAHARAMATEMATGFFGLRNEFPMNIRRQVLGIPPSPSTQKEIERIQATWVQALQQKTPDSGPLLFGHFTIVDAMYAPVVFRFNSYGLCEDETCLAYMQAMLDLPPMQAWAEAAAKEPWTIKQAELNPPT